MGIRNPSLMKSTAEGRMAGRRKLPKIPLRPKALVGVAFLGLLLAVLLVLACERESEVVVALIHEEVSAAGGGTFTSNNGEISLEIPPGALAQDTTITVKEVPQEEWTEDIKALEPVGPVFSLEPDGLEFSQPVRITVRLDPEDLAVLDLEEGIPVFIPLNRSSDGTWDVLRNPITEIQLTTGVVTVSGETTHFSREMHIRYPLVVEIDPPKEIKLVGGYFDPKVTITNLHSSQPLRIEYIFESGTNAVKEPLHQIGVAFRHVSPSSSATFPVNYRCKEVGKGNYYVTVAVLLEPTNEQLVAIVERKEEIEGVTTLILATVFGDATCITITKEEPTPTPPEEEEEEITGPEVPPEEDVPVIPGDEFEDGPPPPPEEEAPTPTSTSEPVTVPNVAPTITGHTTQDIGNHTASIVVFFDDPDSTSFTIEWELSNASGCTGELETLTATSSGGSASNAFFYEEGQTSCADSLITVTVTDAEGGTASTQFPLFE